jgi:hypothetical protein
MIFLIISGFHVLSFVILDFCFCFLIEVGFLAYLKLYKPFKEVNFIIIILERINLWI